jgi:hypothetical protein
MTCERCGQVIEADESYSEWTPGGLHGGQPSQFTHRHGCPVEVKT